MSTCFFASPGILGDSQLAYMNKLQNHLFQMGNVFKKRIDLSFLIRITDIGFLKSVLEYVRLHKIEHCMLLIFQQVL